MEHFICEIIKPIKRRSSRTALDKRKSMTKVLSVYTTAEHCLYQSLRDGQCYNGHNPYTCEEFKRRVDGIDLEGITTELKVRLNDSIVLKYRELAERKKISTVPTPHDDAQLRLRVVASGGGMLDLLFRLKTQIDTLADYDIFLRIFAQSISDI